MYISKAMLNMRGDSLGSTANPTVENPCQPASFAGYSSGNLQSGGIPVSAEVTAALVFSTGDTIPDSVWNNQAQAPFSLTSLRTYLTTNVPGCVMESTFASSGTIRIVNLGNGKRMFDLYTALGRFAYAKAFNRMYLLLSNSASALGTGTASISSLVEFTPQDLISMGVPLTDNGDGTFNLNGTVNINNITFS